MSAFGFAQRIGRAVSIDEKAVEEAVEESGLVESDEAIVAIANELHGGIEDAIEDVAVITYREHDRGQG